MKSKDKLQETEHCCENRSNGSQQSHEDTCSKQLLSMYMYKEVDENTCSKQTNEDTCSKQTNEDTCSKQTDENTCSKQTNIIRTHVHSKQTDEDTCRKQTNKDTCRKQTDVASRLMRIHIASKLNLAISDIPYFLD